MEKMKARLSSRGSLYTMFWDIQIRVLGMCVETSSKWRSSRTYHPSTKLYQDNESPNRFGVDGVLAAYRDIASVSLYDFPHVIGANFNILFSGYANPRWVTLH